MKTYAARHLSTDVDLADASAAHLLCMGGPRVMFQRTHDEEAKQRGMACLVISHAHPARSRLHHLLLCAAAGQHADAASTTTNNGRKNSRDPSPCGLPSRSREEEKPQHVPRWRSADNASALPVSHERAVHARLSSLSCPPSCLDLILGQHARQPATHPPKTDPATVALHPSVNASIRASGRQSSAQGV